MDILVNIDVPDLEQGIAFYTEALPLHLVRRLFDGSVAELSGAPCRLYLLAKEAGSPAASTTTITRGYGRHWTPVHLDFVVDDIEAALRRAQDAGARQETPLQQLDWGQLVTLSDPFGNGFCLLRFHGDGYPAAS
ncbi:MAG TPA: VOC family protein [Noviherbaspirillum sp.]|nr:VOC family protein [Noviherbaspirillum sp.]